MNIRKAISRDKQNTKVAKLRRLRGKLDKMQKVKLRKELAIQTQRNLKKKLIFEEDET